MNHSFNRSYIFMKNAHVNKYIMLSCQVLVYHISETQDKPLLVLHYSQPNKNSFCRAFVLDNVVESGDERK